MLEAKELTVSVKGGIKLLDSISFKVSRGEAIGITGQSGAGKTTFLKAVMGILDASCRITQGEINIDERSLYKMPQRKRRLLCGTTLGFIPQNPMTAFDSRLKMQTQMLETLTLRAGISKEAAIAKSRELMLGLGLTDPDRILSSYPSQLSGGMLQRMAVALLLALEPEYILADEPTSALDQENSSLLLDLIGDQRKNTGIILISHDVKALTKICSRMYIMEHGRLTENGTVEEIFTAPKRPWTKQFIAVNQPVSKEGWVWTD